EETQPVTARAEAEPTLGSEPARRCNCATGIAAQERNRNCEAWSAGVGWEDLSTPCTGHDRAMRAATRRHLLQAGSYRGGGARRLSRTGWRACRKTIPRRQRSRSFADREYTGLRTK